jgi:hypothetical protein
MNRSRNFKGFRGGFSIWAILAVIAVAGVLATLLTPRLGNTDLPAIEANMKEDVKNIKTAVEQGALLTVNKDFENIDLKFLETNKVIKDSFAERVDDTTGVYAAGYEPKITIAAKGDAAYTPANGRFLMLIDFSTLDADKRNNLGPSTFGWLKKFAGNGQIACNAAAVTAYGAGTAVTMGACTDTDAKTGKFVVAF